MTSEIIFQQMGMKRRIVLQVVIVFLLLLWIPVSIDKITNFENFKTGILNQPFSDKLGHVLVYILPGGELLTATALVSEKFRGPGLVSSCLLMSFFTGYIAIALLGAWERLPCGCGLVIRGMTWTQHFFFNLFFLFLSGWGYYLWHKLRGTSAGGGTAKGVSAKRQYKSIF
mgnify:CR=1 FL=1